MPLNALLVMALPVTCALGNALDFAIARLRDSVLCVHPQCGVHADGDLVRKLVKVSAF